MTSFGVDPDDMSLSAFLDELRTAAADTPAPVADDALRTLFRDGLATASMRAPRRRLALRVAVAGAVGGLAFGGLGVAGALPGPVQRSVADVVHHVGVHLPSGASTPATTTTTVPVTTTTTARPAVTPSHPASTTTTVEDRGREDGEKRGRGNDKDEEDRSGRNPNRGRGVHLSDGSHSSHVDGNPGGRTRCATNCSDR